MLGAQSRSGGHLPCCGRVYNCRRTRRSGTFLCHFYIIIHVHYAAHTIRNIASRRTACLFSLSDGRRGAFFSVPYMFVMLRQCNIPLLFTRQTSPPLFFLIPHRIHEYSAPAPHTIAVSSKDGGIAAHNGGISWTTIRKKSDAKQSPSEA